MKQSKHLLGLIVVLIVMFSLFSGSAVFPVQAASIAFFESQVTSNIASQVNPDVYGDIIVWQDNRNGNWDIYIYAPRVNMWNPEIQITTNPADQINPKIFRDLIVYESNQNGNSDIYLYNVTSGVETQITDNPYAQVSPKIDGNCIVFGDNRNGLWDVYVYNLVAQTERRITAYYIDSSYPAISGNRIVYVRNYVGPIGEEGGVIIPSVYCYDLSASAEVQLATNRYSSWFENCVIDESFVAWTESSAGVLDIRMKDITTGAQWQTNAAGAQQNADMSGPYPYKYIVYEDNRNGHFDIYMYLISMESEERVTTSLSNQKMPAIFSGSDDGWLYNTVVYVDDRNGNWDIYTTSFGWVAGGSPLAPSPITPSLVTGQLKEIKSLISDGSQVATSDFAGANDKVKENRRNAMINQLDSAIASVEAAVNTQDLQTRRQYCLNTIDLLNSLIGKMDGWTLRGSADTAGSGFTPDWITAPLYLDQVTRNCRDELQILFDNIA